MNEVLIVSEKEALARHEAVIESGLKTFVDVGDALAAIRDGRLYRAEYVTFEDYCQQRWGIARRTAYQLIGASAVVENVRNCAQILPANEAQARPLTQLLPEEQREVWVQAVETAPDGKVTAAHVEQVVEQYKVSQPVTATVFSHKTVEYYTPPVYLEAAREVMGTIDLDPASCPEAQENVDAVAYYTKDDDGLNKPWRGRVWLNPPYSKTDGKSNQAIWAERLAAEYKAGNVAEAILLVKAALGYNWFEDLWYQWPVCFARNRLSFIKEDGDSDGQSKQGTAFFYFGPNLSKFIEVFREFGRVILPEHGYRARQQA